MSDIAPMSFRNARRLGRPATRALPLPSASAYTDDLAQAASGLAIDSGLTGATPFSDVNLTGSAGKAGKNGSGPGVAGTAGGNGGNITATNNGNGSDTLNTAEG